MNSPKILVLGSLNIDLTSYVPRHPAAGETLKSTSFNISPGGKGANQAVACAKLSRARDQASASICGPAAVYMAGVVGDDQYGGQILSNLSNYGVDTSLVVKSDCATTGTAIIVIEEVTGQNRIIFSPGANNDAHLMGRFVSLDFASQAVKPDLLVMQLEIPVSIVLDTLSSAKTAGIPVILNPAPAQSLPDEAYNGLSHLIVNETEAAILSGCKESDLNEQTGLSRVGRWFLGKQVQNVLITLGSRGVYYCTKDGKENLLPAPKANVVDTTAAGDTFVGSYCNSVVTSAQGGFDIEKAVRNANIAAARTVEKKGAQDSIPWGYELSDV